MQFEYRLKKYLKKKLENNWELNTTPYRKKYDSFIIVPAKAEFKSLPILLNSISNQDKEFLKNCLTVIVINNSIEDSQDILEDNKKSIEYIEKTKFNFDICYVNASNKDNALPKKNAGVGLARKIGADLILQYANESSLLCYTDADSVLSNIYLKKITQYYNKNNCGAAMLSFKHQKNIDSSIEKSIREYEIFLLKTAEDLKNTGSPYGYVSLGSCMTCTASGYIAVGGMNRLQATEDFYFLQELTKHFELMHTIKDQLVYPSSRISSRVYLGTGYRMGKVKEGLNISSLYFSEESFENLYKFLLIIEKSYELNINKLLDKTTEIPELNNFLKKQEIDKVWDSLINNIDYKKYISQFHRWFDALKTIKFLKYFSTNYD